jgi:hypothetical protein
MYAASPFSQVMKMGWQLAGLFSDASLVGIAF